MERRWKAERALLGRILYKNKNQFARRFKVYDRLRAVFDSSETFADRHRIERDIDKAKVEILLLLPLGHNLPFLLPSLAAIARMHCLLIPTRPTPAIVDDSEDWGEPVT